MIIREIVTQPELEDDFDFFNDYDDTVHYLERFAQHSPDPEKYRAIIERLKPKYEAFLAEWRKRHTKG